MTKRIEDILRAQAARIAAEMTEKYPEKRELYAARLAAYEPVRKAPNGPQETNPVT